MSNVIVAALEDESDFNVLGCVKSIDEAMKIVNENEVDVDVVLVSTRLPDQGVLTLTKSIAELAPETKVLALGLTEEKKRVLRFVEAGATGYFLKDDSLDDLIHKVHAAEEDKVYVSPKIAAAMMERISDLAQVFSNVENSVAEEAGLTTRELEVLELIGKGLTNQQTVEQLVIEVDTVKNHVHSILDKHNVSSQGEAAAYLAFIEK